MEASRQKTYSINDFFQWKKRDELILQPKFQRRSIWPDKARSYLIDTIVRGKPIPPIYIRQMLEIRERVTMREVVDGQQRLRAIFDYLDGEFPIQRTHNEEYGKLRFEDLPLEEQERFLNYEISVALLVGASDPEVLDVFARINSFTKTLNAQEKRNARFYGAFKTFAYRIGYKHLPFWQTEGVLKPGRVARMGEAELSSEFIVLAIDGLQHKKKILDDYYERFDDDLPEEKDIEKRIETCMNLIGNIWSGCIKGTRFASVPIFYSLFSVVYDLVHGIPGGDGISGMGIPRRKWDELRRALSELSDLIRSKAVPPQHKEFVDACTRSTDFLEMRKIRHEAIKDEFLKAIEG